MTDTAEMTSSSVDEKVLDAQLQTPEVSPDQVAVTHSNEQTGEPGKQTGSSPGATATPKEEHPVTSSGLVVDSAIESPLDNNRPLTPPSVEESTVPSAVEYSESQTETCPVEMAVTMDSEQGVKSEQNSDAEISPALTEEAQGETLMTDKEIAVSNEPVNDISESNPVTDESIKDQPTVPIPPSDPEPVAEEDMTSPSKCSDKDTNQNLSPASPAEKPANSGPISPTASASDIKSCPDADNKRAKYDIDRQHVIQAFQAPSDDMDFGDLLKSYEKQERKLEKSAKASHPRSKPPPSSPPKSGKSTSKRGKKRPKKKEWKRPPSQEPWASEPTPNDAGLADQKPDVTTAAAAPLLTQNLTNELAMLAVLSATLNGAGANTALTSGAAAIPSLPFTTPQSGPAPSHSTSHPVDPRLRLLGESAAYSAPNPVPSLAPMLDPSAALMQSLGALLPAMSASLPTSSAPTPTPSTSAPTHGRSYPRPSPPPRHRNPPSRPPPKKINVSTLLLHLTTIDAMFDDITTQLGEISAEAREQHTWIKQRLTKGEKSDGGLTPCSPLASPPVTSQLTGSDESLLTTCLQHIQQLQQILDATDPLTTVAHPPSTKDEVGSPTAGRGSPTSCTTPCPMNNESVASAVTLVNKARSAHTRLSEIDQQLQQLVFTGEKWSDAYRELRQSYERLQARWRAVQELMADSPTSTRVCASNANDVPDQTLIKQGTMMSNGNGSSTAKVLPVEGIPDHVSVDSKRSSVCDDPHSQRFRDQFAECKAQLLRLQSSSLETIGTTATKYLQRLENICVEVNEEAAELENRIDTLTAMHEQDQALITEKDRTISQYSENTVTLENHIQQLRTSASKERQRRETLEVQWQATLADLKQQLSQKERECQDKDNQVGRLHETTRDQEERLLAEQQRASELQASLNANNNQSEQLLQRLEALKANEEFTRSSYQQLLGEKESLVSQHRTRLEELQSNAAREQVRWQEQLDAQRQEVHQLNETVFSLQSKLHTTQTEHRALTQSLSQILGPLGFVDNSQQWEVSVTRFSQHLRTQQHRLEQDLTESASRCKELESAQQQLKDAWYKEQSKWKHERSQLALQSQDHQSKLRHQEELCSQYQKELQECNGKLERSRREFGAMETKLLNHSRALEKAKKELEPAMRSWKLLPRLLTRVTALADQFQGYQTTTTRILTKWRNTLGQYDHRLDALSQQWRSSVITRQALAQNHQTYRREVHVWESRVNKMAQSRNALETEIRRLQDQHAQEISRYQVENESLKEAEDRSAYWQERALALQKSVTQAMEEKSRAIIEAQKWQFELEKAKVADLGAGSVCGSLAGGPTPSVTSVTSLVRHRRRRSRRGEDAENIVPGMSTNASDVTSVASISRFRPRSAEKGSEYLLRDRGITTSNDATLTTTNMPPPVAPMTVTCNRPVLKRKNSDASEISLISRYSIASRRSYPTNAMSTRGNISGQIQEPLADNNSTTLVAGSSSTKRTRPVCVLFSGFQSSGSAPEYSSDAKSNLIRSIESLGGRVLSDHSEFDPAVVTHVITMPGRRTLKVFAAAVSSCWIIHNQEWVKESVRRGYFIEEFSYGQRYLEQPFANKTFYMAPSFVLEHQRHSPHKLDSFKALVVNFGQGRITQTVGEATHCIKGTNDHNRYTPTDL
ncbi:hypothetical protein IWQ62_000447, partial [Dispira parvispora]